MGGQAKVSEVLAAIAGDDEHTGADGAYNRVLKARKWVYLTSVLAVLFAYNLINLTALRKLTGGVVTIPADLLGNGILFGLFYMLIVYGLLLVQLAFSYSTIIRSRLPDNQQTMNARLGIHNTTVLIAQAEREMDEALKGDGDALDASRRYHKYEEQLAEYEKELRSCLAADVTSLRRFRFPEYMIDLTRVGAPATTALYALWMMYHSDWVRFHELIEKAG